MVPSPRLPGNSTPQQGISKRPSTGDGPEDGKKWCRLTAPANQNNIFEEVKPDVKIAAEVEPILVGTPEPIKVKDEPVEEIVDFVVIEADSHY
jgi:hypothetical protein